MKLSNKITIFIVLAVVVTFAGLGFVNKVNMNKLIVENEDKKVNAMVTTINSMIDKEIESTKVSVFSIAKDPHIAELFANRDRETLLAELLPVFESFKKEVAQFQFHMPNSDSFLRLHKPKKYGDSLKTFRFTVNKANETKQVVSGIEKGRAGFGIRVVSPVTFNNEHVGTVEFGKNFGTNFLKPIKEDFSCELALYDINDKGELITIASTKDFEYRFKKSNISKVLAGEVVSYNVDGGTNKNIMMPFNNYNGDVEGMILLNVSRKDELNVVKTNRVSNILLSFVFAVILFVIIFVIIKIMVCAPIKKLKKIIVKTSNLDFTGSSETEDFTNRKDEIGEIVRALEHMVDSLVHIVSKINTHAQNTAATAEELTATAQSTSSSAHDVNSAVRNIADGATNQANDTETAVSRIGESSQLVKEMAGVLQELSTAIESINEKKEEGKKALDAMIRIAEDNRNNAEGVRAIITRTNESAESISKASEMIQSIADQTNLLALNAAIEAARAGEAGKGFAVVAEEIRKLAEDSTKFTEEIKKIIDELKDKTKHAVDTIAAVSKDMVEQGEKTKVTQDKFNDIEEAVLKSKDIVTLVDERARDLENKNVQINSVIQNLSAIAEENAAAADEGSSAVESQVTSIGDISKASENLATIATDLQSEVMEFKL